MNKNRNLSSDNEETEEYIKNNKNIIHDNDGYIKLTSNIALFIFILIVIILLILCSSFHGLYSDQTVNLLIFLLVLGIIWFYIGFSNY